MVLNDKFIENVFGQIQSGMGVGVVLENLREADELAAKIGKKYLLEVEVSPGFMWTGAGDLHKGFIFTKKKK